MREYGVYEAKTKLPDLIKQVQQGGHITITNRGEPVADLVPSASRAAQQIQEAIAGIKAMRAANSRDKQAGNINQQEFVEMRSRGRR